MKPGGEEPLRRHAESNAITVDILDPSRHSLASIDVRQSDIQVMPRDRMERSSMRILA